MTELIIPINLTYCEAELVRGAIDVVSSNYNRDDRRILTEVMLRINDQMFQSRIDAIKSTPITETLYGDHPDFLEIV
jgi:hypothetical protein